MYLIVKNIMGENMRKGSLYLYSSYMKYFIIIFERYTEFRNGLLSPKWERTRDPIWHAFYLFFILKYVISLLNIPAQYNLLKCNDESSIIKLIKYSYLCRKAVSYARKLYWYLKI